MEAKQDHHDIPEDFYCSISGQIMMDPVMVVETGHSYEREEIEQWFLHHHKDPLSGAELSSTKLSENHTLRKIILRELERNPLLFHTDEVYLPSQLKTDFLQACQQEDVVTFEACVGKHPGLLTRPLNDLNQTCLVILLATGSLLMLQRYIRNILTKHPEMKLAEQLQKYRDQALKLFKAAILVEGGSCEAVSALLKVFGHEVLHESDDEALYCIHYAAQVNNPELMKTLIGAGADINQTPDPDKNEDEPVITALHIAAALGHDDLINELIATSGIELIRWANNIGFYREIIGVVNDYFYELNAAHMAAFNGHLSSLKRLVEAEPGFMNFDYAEGQYPMIDIAIAGRDAETVAWLCSQLSLLGEDYDREETLDKVAQVGSVDIYHILSEYEMKPKNPTLFFHQALEFATISDTPLRQAEQLEKDGQLLEWFDFLQDKGIDINAHYSKEDDGEEDQALHLACKINMPRTCQRLIDAGAELTSFNGEGLTPMLTAAKHSAVDACRVMLEHVPLDERSEKGGQTALHLMCSKQIAELFIERGLDVNVENAAGNVPLIRLFNHAPYSGDADKDFMDVLRYLVKSGADVNCVSDQSIRPIELACQRRVHNVLEFLLECGADCNFRNSKGETLLWSIKDVQTLERILALKQFASSAENAVSFINQQDDDGNTFLHEQCDTYFSYDLELPLALIQHGADLTLFNKKGQQPIHLFMQSVFSEKWKELVELMLQHVDVNTATKDKNETLLHLVLRQSTNGNDQKAQFLLDHGAYPELKTNENRTSMDLAVCSKLPSKVQLLLDAGISINERGVAGYTPMHWAAQIADTEMVAYLHDRDANINLRDKWGYTPLLRAVYGGHVDICQQLLALGANADVRTNEHESLFHICVDKKQAKLLSELELKDAALYLNDLNNDGLSALHLAIQNNDEEGVTILMGLQADCQVKTADGATVLHLLARSSLAMSIVESIVPLCQRYIDERDKKGLTPLLLAAGQNRPEMVRLLVEAGANIKLTCQKEEADAQVEANVLYELIEQTDSETAGDSSLCEVISWLLDFGCQPEVSVTRGDSSFMYPLLPLAVLRGSLVAVQRLIASGQLVATIDETFPLLQLAYCDSDVPLCQFLLEQGAKLDHHALTIALQNGETEMVAFLISQGVELNQPGYLERGQFEETSNLERRLPLIVAIKNYMPECLESLLEAGADINQKDCGFTPVQWAVNQLVGMSGIRRRRWNHLKIDCLQRLLARKPDLTILSGDGDNTVQHLVKVGCVKALDAFPREALLERFHDVDPAGRKPIHLAVAVNQVDTVTALIKLAPVMLRFTTEDKIADTPIHLAVRQDNLEMVLALLKSSAYFQNIDLASFTNALGQTPLHLARSAAVTESLIQHRYCHGSNTVRPAHDSWSLTIAIKGGGYQGVKQRASSCPQVKDNQGNLPLHTCTSVSVAQYLIKHDESFLLEKNNAGQVPFLALFARGLMDDDTFGLAELLLEKCGESVLAMTDERGLTALHHACNNNDVKAVAWLCEHGAPVNSACKYNYERYQTDFSPVHFAAKNNSCEMLETLVKYGAQINSTDYRTKPLAIAAMEAADDAFRYLYPRTDDPLHVGQTSKDNLLICVAIGGSLSIYQQLPESLIASAKQAGKWSSLFIALAFNHVAFAHVLLDNQELVQAALDELGGEIVHFLALGMRDHRVIERVLALDVSLSSKAKHADLTPVLIAAKYRNLPVLNALIDRQVNLTDLGNQSSLKYSAEDFGLLNCEAHPFDNHIEKILGSNTPFVNVLGVLTAHCHAQMTEKDPVLAAIKRLLDSGVKPELYLDKAASKPIHSLLNEAVKVTKCMPLIRLFVNAGEAVHSSLLRDACIPAYPDQTLPEALLLEILDYLIGRGVDVNDMTDQEESVLHYAVANNLKAVAEHLLERGAIPKLRDSQGRSAFKAGRSAGHDTNYLYFKLRDLESERDTELVALRQEVVQLRDDLAAVKSYAATPFSQNPHRLHPLRAGESESADEVDSELTTKLGLA